MSENRFSKFVEQDPSAGGNRFSQFVEQEEQEQEEHTPIADFLQSASTLPERLSGSFLEGVDRVREDAQDVEGGMDNPVTTGANIARIGLEGLNEVAETGAAAWKATWGQHPMFDNDFVRSALSEVAESDTANYVMDVLNKGYDAWQGYKERNPTEAALIEDTGVVAEVLGPKVPGVSKITRKVANKADLEKRSRKWKRKGNQQDIDERKEGVTALLEPDNKYDPTLGDTIENDNLLRTKQFVPNDRLDTIIESTSLVDDVNPKRSYTFNNMKIRDETKNLRKETNKVLLKHGNPKVDKTELIDDLNRVLDDMSSVPGYHSLSGDARKYAEDYYQEVMRILQDKKGSRATQILDARREFDKWVNAGSKVYDVNRESAKQVAASHIRNVLNDSVKRVDPSGDVHDLLTRQHNLLSASDMLGSKIAKEAGNVFSRTWHGMRELAHLPSTPLAIYATAVPLATTALGPAVGGGVAVGGAAWQTYKALTSAQRKREIGRLLSWIDKNADLKKNLAAERVFLVELLKAEQEAEAE